MGVILSRAACGALCAGGTCIGMGREIQLIWDFRGNDAQGIAEHHARHLLEFARREQLSIQRTGAEQLSEWHWMAWMVVEEEDVPALRKALNPSRGLAVEGSGGG